MHTTGRSAVAVAVLALGATFAGAAGASARPKAATAARQFLSDSAAANTASARFESVALTWLDNPSVTDRAAKAAARPLIAALVQMERKVAHQRWPKGVRADLASLGASFVGLVSDLRALSHADFAKGSAWEAPLLADQSRTLSVTDRVRHDLGLKPLVGL